VCGGCTVSEQSTASGVTAAWPDAALAPKYEPAMRMARDNGITAATGRERFFMCLLLEAMGRWDAGIGVGTVAGPPPS
jgi:hypothetical protein